MILYLLVERAVTFIHWMKGRMEGIKSDGLKAVAQDTMDEMVHCENCVHVMQNFIEEKCDT